MRFTKWGLRWPHGCGLNFIVGGNEKSECIYIEIGRKVVVVAIKQKSFTIQYMSLKRKGTTCRRGDHKDSDSRPTFMVLPSADLLFCSGYFLSFPFAALEPR